MKELKGIEEFHPAEADLPQPLAWKGKPKSFRAGPGGNSGRKKQGCHYYCRNWPYGNCRVNFCNVLSAQDHDIIFFRLNTMTKIIRHTPPASLLIMIKRNNTFTAIIQSKKLKKLFKKKLDLAFDSVKPDDWFLSLIWFNSGQD